MALVKAEGAFQFLHATTDLNTNWSWASLHATIWEHSQVSKSKARGDHHKNAKQTTCTAVHTSHDPAGAYFTAAILALPHLFYAVFIEALHSAL